MTREEAIRILREIQYPVNGDNKEERDSSISMAIKALEQEPCDKYIKEIDHLRKYIYKLETQIVEQEPCEDVISRQAVLDIWHTSYSDNREENEEIQYKKIAFELPSVTPKPEIGRWVDTESDAFENYHVYQCSNCKQYELIEYPEYVSRFKFCPNCGQPKMQEVQK